MNLHGENDVVVEKEVPNPSNDVNDDVENYVNEVPKDPKQTSLKHFSSPCMSLKTWPRLSLVCNLGSF